jgi:four helix bundle protein
MANFKELLVWQKSVNFVTEIYIVTELFPKNEIYGLTSQIRRASVSIPLILRKEIPEGVKHTIYSF